MSKLMSKRIRASVLGLAAVALAAAFISGPAATAHDGHKRRHTPASAKKLKNPLAATDENVAAGRELYSQHCASCHGEDGKANTDVAAGMRVKPTDLTDKAMHGIADGEIYWVIENGIKKSGMPALKAKTTAEERWRMTLYVKHLMGEHPHAGGKH